MAQAAAVVNAALRGRAVAALLFNAMVWGLSWWPLRQLHGAGVHPLWATALTYAAAIAVLTWRDPAAWGALLRQPPLWFIVLAAGATNACFNWGVTVGDVVRVVLLFYLMPLWAVLLARWLLHEAITAAALARVALSLAGAIIVLWPPQTHEALRFDPLDLFGLVGGFSFALNNVMLRREKQRAESARALAMFVGGCVVALALALGLGVPAPAPAAGWLLMALALAAAFLAGNLMLQYATAHLSANAVAVIMLTEVLWATFSALALDAGALTLRLALGGALIVGAAALAAWRP